MKIRTLVSAIGLLSLSFLMGCNKDGSVSFDYVLLIIENGNIVAAPDCVSAGVTDVKFLIGDDDNANGTLDDAEAVTTVTVGCNQNDANNDGILDAAELGLFESGREIPPGNFEAFAVEFLDANGTALGWQTFDINQDFQRFTFKGANGTEILKKQDTFLDFQGDGAQVNTELQSFFGF